MGRTDRSAQGQSATARAEIVHDYGQALDGFQHKHTEALTRLKELKASGDDAWDDLVAGLEKILVEGRGACHNAVSRFKS